jgi:dephospho-CoA kinase
MIVGIAGKIASGKSTLARALAIRLGARRLGFGDYVRSIAQSRGLDPSDRAVLQTLGQDLATGDPAAFVSDILTFSNYVPGEDIIFDGIRHQAVWSEIESVALRANDSAILVFLHMPEELRRLRLAARGVDRETADASDSHASEIDLEAHLREAADFTVDARLEEALLVDAVVRSMESI